MSTERLVGIETLWEKASEVWVSGDITPLKVASITPDVWVVREEIVSMEYEMGITDYYSNIEKKGTTLTLKNGRKIYVSGMRPEEILAKLTILPAVNK